MNLVCASKKQIRAYRQERKDKARDVLYGVTHVASDEGNISIPYHFEKVLVDFAKSTFSHMGFDLSEEEMRDLGGYRREFKIYRAWTWLREKSRQEGRPLTDRVEEGIGGLLIPNYERPDPRMDSYVKTLFRENFEPNYVGMGMRPMMVQSRCWSLTVPQAKGMKRVFNYFSELEQKDIEGVGLNLRRYFLGL